LAKLEKRRGTMTPEELATLEDIRRKAQQIEQGAMRLVEIRRATLRMKSDTVEGRGSSSNV
jgi:hypothetical protein